ncbi:transcription termination factor NusA [uncultured Allofournierella sp.]|uniref:transcription termination factor NusA n=1 Tax=uncultured Allofournierella sp. TaxID=1940258 RepID=UPI003753217A
MNAEFFEALTMLEKERGLTAEYLIEKIKAAIVIAVKKDYEVEDENVLVEIDSVHGKFTVSLVRDIVEEVENPHTQMTLEEAQAIRKTYKLGQRVVTPLKTKDFGRIAAQTAKHVIRQGIREAERNQLFNEMQGKAHEIVTARVTRVDHDRGIVALDMGKGEAVLTRSEQVPGEELFEGQHVQVYIKDVVVTDRGPRVIISRTSEQLVKRMFEMEVPEIFDGTVEIKAISREAGVRTKMAVWSKDENIDAVGSCIGAHGVRVGKIVEELHGEKIDVVRWSENVEEFISAALSPAKVLKVELLEGEKKACRVTVPDHQLSLAIGNKGQNARLCARLTGYNIDIRPESGYFGEEEPKAEPQAEETAAEA